MRLAASTSRVSFSMLTSRRRTRSRRAGGEGVAVRGGAGEAFGQGFEVELALLARLQQGFDRDDVGFHVAQGAEVVLVGVFFEGGEAFGGLVDALGEGVEWRFDAWFEGDAGDNLFDVREVFVEFIGFFAHLNEAFVGFVDFAEGVDKGVGDTVEERIAFRDAASRRTYPHVRIPVLGLEEDGYDSGAAENRVKRDAFEETVEGMGSAGHEIGAEAVTADVFEGVFVGQRGDGTLRIVSEERFIEEDEVGEASADIGGGLLEGFEVRLQSRGLARHRRTAFDTDIRVW